MGGRLGIGKSRLIGGGMGGLYKCYEEAEGERWEVVRGGNGNRYKGGIEWMGGGGWMVGGGEKRWKRGDEGGGEMGRGEGKGVLLRGWVSGGL